MVKRTILYFLFLIFWTPITAQKVNLLPVSTTGQIITHKYYFLSYSAQNKQAEWVFYLLTRTNSIGAFERGNNFRPDKMVTTGSASLEDYRNSGYDRGHLCPAADMAFNSDAMSESFLLSNMSPQNPSFNRGIWKSLEDMVRKWAIQEDSIYVVTGPLFIDNRGSIGVNQITVPGFFYKIIYDITGEQKMIGFIIPNEKCDSKLLFQYAVTVDYIESISGIDFFHELPDPLEEQLESIAEINLWDI